MGGHELVYSHDRDTTLIKLVCHETVGSKCRTMVKGDWESEPFGLRQTEDYGSCIAAESFALDNIVPELEQHPGTTFEIGRFPVSVRWDGEDWVWERVVTPEPSRDQRLEDAEYLAQVISRGRMIGASWLVIAQRIVQTDLPGMGYEKRSS